MRIRLTNPKTSNVAGVSIVFDYARVIQTSIDVDAETVHFHYTFCRESDGQWYDHPDGPFEYTACGGDFGTCVALLQDTSGSATLDERRLEYLSAQVPDLAGKVVS